MKFPILTLFLLDIGFSIVSIGVGYSIMSITTILGILPLSILADMSNRKLIFVFGLIIEAFSALLFALSDTLSLMYVAFVFWGLGMATFSGVLQGWYVNSIHKLQYSISKTKVFSKTQSLSNFATFLGIVFSAFMTQLYRYAYTFKLIFVLLLFYTVTIFLVIDGKSLKSHDANFSFFRHIYFFRDRKFLMVLIFFAILGFIYNGYAVIWMPVFQNILGDTMHYSLLVNSSIYGLIYLLSGLCVIWLYRYIELISNNLMWQVVVLRWLFSISFIMMGFFVSNIVVFAIMTLSMFVFGDLEYGPLGELNNTLFKDSNRIFGLLSLAAGERVLASFGGFNITLIYKYFGVGNTLIFIGVLSFVSTLTLLWVRNE